MKLQVINILEGYIYRALLQPDSEFERVFLSLLKCISVGKVTLRGFLRMDFFL